MNEQAFVLEEGFTADLCMRVQKYFSKSGEIRVMIPAGLGEYLSVSRTVNHSEIYPELELYKLEYYEDQGEYDGEKVYKPHGPEYFSIGDEANLYKAVLQRLVDVSPQKQSGLGFAKVDCVAAYHHVINLK